MARDIFDWTLIVVCIVIIVLALRGSIDPTRRLIMVLASIFVGVRHGVELFNRREG